MIENFGGEHGEKWLVPVCWRDSKIDFISKSEINWFCTGFYKSKKAKSCFDEFWVDVVKNDHCLLVHETLKSAAY